MSWNKNMEGDMPKGKISGKVLDQNRNPINEAEVKVFKREESIKKPRKDMTITGKSSPIGTAITSEKGLYEADVTLEDSLEVVIVKAYAFDTESEDGEAEVSEHGSSKVDLRVPVAIKVTSHRMKENQETRLETQFTEGEVVILRAEINIRGRVVDDPERLQHYGYNWKVESGSLVEQRGHQSLPEVHWDTTGLRGVHTATVIVSGGSSGSSSPSEITVLPRALQRVDNVPVTMRRTAAEPTEDLALWVVIRRSAEAISFEKYSQSMDMLLCGRDAELNKLRDGIGYLPYSDLYAYKLLKAATEAFLMVNCGVAITKEFSKDELDYVMRRVGVGAISLDEFWDKYLRLLNGGPDRVIPYLALIREKLSDVRLVGPWRTGSTQDAGDRPIAAAEQPDLGIPPGRTVSARSLAAGLRI